MTDQQNQKGDNVLGDKIVTIINSSPSDTQNPIGLDSPKIQISKLPRTNSQLFGRKSELQLLDVAWNNLQTNILTCRSSDLI